MILVFMTLHLGTSDDQWNTIAKELLRKSAGLTGSTSNSWIVICPSITPKVGDSKYRHADGQVCPLKINGDKKYLFAMMDHDTRFQDCSQQSGKSVNLSILC